MCIRDRLKCLVAMVMIVMMRHTWMLTVAMVVVKGEVGRGEGNPLSKVDGGGERLLVMGICLITMEGVEGA